MESMAISFHLGLLNVLAGAFTFHKSCESLQDRFMKVMGSTAEWSKSVTAFIAGLKCIHPVAM